MNNIESSLLALGLNSKQIEVYLATLELGTATIQEISEKSGIKRTSIYNFLEDMKKNGLLSELKQGTKTILVAENPNVLINNAKEKIDKAKKEMERIEEIVPELMGIFNMPGSKPKVWFYTGIDGLKKAYEDTYSHGSPLYGFAEWEGILKNKEMFDWLWGKFADERAKRNVKFQVIAKDDEAGRMIKSSDKKHMRETRLVKNVDFDTEINMYGGNRVAMMSFKRPYSAVIIEDKAIYNTLLSIWKLQWGSLK